jgi:outer membrane murein-binding lipoprotein Lpp
MNISQKLDQLHEYQEQIIYLELQKQELLDQVKVPAEVLAAQDEANKARQAIDSEFYKHEKARDEVKKIMLSEVKDPEMPPEFIAALAEARQKREEIEAQFSQDRTLYQQGAAAAKAKIDAGLQFKIQDVYNQVALRKQEINAEFSEKASGAEENITLLTAEIKQEVKAHGESVKGHYLHAIYIKGRVTWSTDALEGVYFTLHKVMNMVASMPEIQDVVSGIIQALTKARKEGEPSITIRKI